MPARPYDPSAPTVYLDQSTLSYAFRGFRGDEGYEVYEPLKAWVERVATQANLCLSAAHVLEMASWQDTGSATAMAEWLDGLQVVWTRWFEPLQSDEEDYAIKLVSGEQSVDPPNPFVASLLLAVSENWRIELTVDAFRKPTIPEAVRQIRGRDEAKERSFAPTWIELLQTDLEAAKADGLDEEELEDYIRGRLDDQLRHKALQAYERVWRGVPRPDRPDRDSLVADFVALYHKDPKFLRVTRVLRAFYKGFRSTTANRKADSNRTKKDFSSTFQDMVHLAVGAAYCDIFTCDAFVVECLGYVRERIGLAPPIHLDGADPDEFVDRLLASCCP